ncbi:MAG: hypothetical protein KME31_18695 [Tolypothrix carrinoi HA7290-LM1]|nr:hypothetical protein [Tolypothrix carrinoi HA7290-LM1]
MGIGHWELKKRLYADAGSNTILSMSHAHCPMTAGAPRRSDTKTALPPPCPMPHAPCPMPHAHCPLPHALYYDDRRDKSRHY